MRYLASLSLISMLAVPALAGNRVDPTGAADTERLRGNVLVWHDATLLTEPSETARTLSLATFDTARKDRVGHVVPMHVVSVAGNFVEVEPIDGTDCTWSRLRVPDDIAKVSLFVKRSDLAPVLVKPFVKTFENGTSIALKPGMPVVATNDGGYVISLRGDELATEIPANAVGYAYTPASSRSAALAGHVLAVAAGTKATLGDRTFALSAWEGAPVERRDGTTVLALEDRCATAHVIVPAKATTDASEDDLDIGTSGGGGGGVGGLRDEVYIPRLSPLMVGTRRVAVAAKPIYLFAEPTGNRACVDRKLRIESGIPALEPKHADDRLRLCVPASKLGRDKLRTSRSANGTTTR